MNGESAESRAPSAPGFPREEFGRLIRRMPKYARLAWALARDKRLSRVRRAAVLAAAAYVVSPIDVVPGVIPVAGQLDDVLIALAAIRLALDGLRPEARAERLAMVGMTQADVADDFRTSVAIGKWMGRSGIRVGRRLAGSAVETGGRVGDRLLGKARSLRARIVGRE